MSQYKNKHIRRKTVCRDCSGNGFIMVENNNGDLKHQYTRFACDTCCGSGIVSIEITVTHAPFLKGVLDVVKRDIQ